MEGLLRPIGPEEERTYWIRRGLLLLVVVLLLIGLGFLISSLGQADGTRVEAEPVSTPAVAPAPAEPTSEAAETVVRDEAVPVPSSARTDGSDTVAATGGAPAAEEEPMPPEPANTFHQEPPQAAPVPQGQAAPQAEAAAVQPCDPAALRVAVETQAIKVGGSAQVRVSVTNTGQQACRLTVDKNNFALTVAAGDQQLWSGNDCVAAAPARAATLAPGVSMNWTAEWRGEKQSPQCQGNPEQVGPGDYVVKAELKGVPAVTAKQTVQA
ncbi:hypothetical protein AADG42_04945 [Ammonicoccus fulvus]|uniref:Intracellular proteinase inhibitor BsuPI domain-containing protein n=1 Tax=Ammonicoccus fulvus TaxID=3138240 RepID=A0ABZ3FNC8_9ACTN